MALATAVEARRVVREPGQLPGQLLDQRGEPSRYGGQGVEHLIVPAVIRVVVGRHRIARHRSDLPARSDLLEAAVDRQEPRVDVDDHCPGASLVQLIAQPSLVLGPASIRQRPPAAVRERRPTHPSHGLEVQQPLLDLERVLVEPPRDALGLAVSQQANGVQRQRVRLGDLSAHPRILSVS